MRNRTLPGLYTLADYEKQDQIKTEVEYAFEQLTDSLATAREDARELYRLIKDVFYTQPDWLFKEDECTTGIAGR